MKHYTIDEINLLATIPGALKKNLHLFDNFHSDRANLQQVEKMLDDNSILFVSQALSSDFEIFETTILIGIENFVSQNKEERQKYLEQRIRGFKNIAEGKAGSLIFNNRQDLIYHLLDQNKSDYFRAIAKYLGVKDLVMIKEYNEKFEEIINSL